MSENVVEGKSLDESLDDLQRATEKMAALLKERQTGLMSWHMLLRDACLEQHKALRGLGVCQTPEGVEA